MLRTVRSYVRVCRPRSFAAPGSSMVTRRFYGSEEDDDVPFWKVPQIDYMDAHQHSESSESTVDELFENNKEWRRGIKDSDPSFFKRHATSQTPRYLWIGCSDSRVPPESLCGLPPGSLFVHRNIANTVNNVDVSAMSVIQYAVENLKVQHIVICGHYNCGGVIASMQGVDHGSPLENWLRNIRDVYRLHQMELGRIASEEDRARRLVELNVLEQAMNLYKTRVVQKRRVETYKDLDEHGFIQPKIHPVVYEPGTGELRPLGGELREMLEELKPIYNLYTTGVLDEDGDDDEFWEGMGPSPITP